VIIKSVPSEPKPGQPTLSTAYDWKVVEPRVRKFAKEVGIIREVSRAMGKKPEVGYVEAPPRSTASRTSGTYAAG